MFGAETWIPPNRREKRNVTEDMNARRGKSVKNEQNVRNGKSATGGKSESG
jgi:hypothetical protein